MTTFKARFDKKNLIQNPDGTYTVKKDVLYKPKEQLLKPRNNEHYYEFLIDPNTKPRMTRQDRWAKRPCVIRYWAFKDKLVKQAKELMYQEREIIDIQFIIPMPASWSKKKKHFMNGLAHQTTPDIDNLSKAFFDCLYSQDKEIWDLHATKTWGYIGKIIVKKD